MITAELPGLDEKYSDVSMFGDVLVIKGEEAQNNEEKDTNDDMSERSYGSFQRSFRLPDGVDQDKMSRSFRKAF